MWHITDDGETKECTATTKPCEYARNGLYETEADARRSCEKIMAVYVPEKKFKKLSQEIAAVDGEYAKSEEFKSIQRAYEKLSKQLQESRKQALTDPTHFSASEIERLEKRVFNVSYALELSRAKHYCRHIKTPHLSNDLLTKHYFDPIEEGLWVKMRGVVYSNSRSMPKEQREQFIKRVAKAHSKANND